MVTEEPPSLPQPWWARSGADVVLLRALGDVPAGRFLECRGPDVTGPPVLARLLDAGWIGTIAKAGTTPSESVRAGGSPLHVAVVSMDVAPDQHEWVVNLARLEPWVLLVGIHPDQDRSILINLLASAGYRTTLYDGLFLYFVADDQMADLAKALSYPACARDHELADGDADLLIQSRRREAAALESALRWKERAVSAWADTSRGAAADRAELVDLRGHAHELSVELGAIRQTLSWRVTAPLRGVRRLRPGRAR